MAAQDDETGAPRRDAGAGRAAEAERGIAENVLERSSRQGVRLSDSEPFVDGAERATQAQAVRRRANARVADGAPAKDEGARAFPVDASTVPVRVAERFVRVGATYCFADRTVAFVDQGAKLRAETENEAVLRDLVVIAMSRGWERARVGGSEHFRRTIWREASLQGLAIDGYVPSPEEQASLARAISGREAADERSEATGDRVAGDERASDASAAPDARSGEGRRMRRSEGGPRLVSPAEATVFGRLVEHGEAPYKFDRNNDPSYYVKLETEGGRGRVIWGMGLASALESASTRPATGAGVGVRQIGQRTVLVTTRQVDAETGELVETQAPAQRKEWVVEAASYFDDPKRLAEDVRARQAKARAAKASFESFVDVEAVRDGAGDATSAPTSHPVERSDVRGVGTSPARTSRDASADAVRFSTAKVRDLFVESFIAAGLLREEDRTRAAEIFEVQAAARRGLGQASREQVQRAVVHSIERAARNMHERRDVSVGADESIKRPAKARVEAPVRG